MIAHTHTGPSWNPPLLWSGYVPADNPWFQVPIIILPGRRYWFQATGHWQDASIVCDANGHDEPKLRPFKWLMRYRGEGVIWFTLIGAIDKNPLTYFAIGDGKRLKDGWVASVSGRLFCFANDARLMYWNNSGCIRLEIWMEEG